MTDPRSYRPATSPNGDRVRHACGCTVAATPPSGVLRSVSKCRSHRAGARDPAGLGAAYYATCGLIDGEGRRLRTAHVAELTEALGPFPAREGGAALEVGCGVSPYVEAIRGAGYDYHAVEPCGWAADWMEERYGWCVIRARFEAMPGGPPGFDLILAAHSLEHMPDAPGAIQKCAGLLRPGGELWVVVPDDSDLFNADHLYYFTPETLAGCVAGAGLTVEALEVRRYVAHERFIYAKASKP
jgi:SAM-dependent methyltransferase